MAVGAANPAIVFLCACVVVVKERMIITRKDIEA